MRQALAVVGVGQVKTTDGAAATVEVAWQVVVSGSQDLETSDMGAEKGEVLRVRPEVRYRTEINVEGPYGGEAMAIAAVSAQRVAFKLRGVVYDPQMDALILPISEGPLAAAADASAAARPGGQ